VATARAYTHLGYPLPGNRNGGLFAEEDE